jgi:hypothetical protein
MSAFVFHSEQTHSSSVNGKTLVKKNIVNIENGKGTKTVKYIENGKERTATRKITPAQMKKIKNGIFVPKLFQPCYDCLNGSKMRNKTGSRSKTYKKKGSR